MSMNPPSPCPAAAGAPSSVRVVAAILAAGGGTRFGGDKVWALLGGEPVWLSSFRAFQSHPQIDGVGVVVSAKRLEDARSLAPHAAFVISGGADRQASSKAATEAAEADMVLVHDAARPFVSAEVISRVLEGVRRTGGAAPSIAVADTLRSHETLAIIDRSAVVAMQTPQGARRDLLLAAHCGATQIYTDEMALLAAAGQPFELVAGSEEAFKITTPVDLARARMVLGGPETRTGFGYDIHAFSTDPSRPMMLGGIRFDGPGLEGHSDADVLIHAMVDALLGAAGLGDIGQHFPNTDERWRGKPSITFLRHASDELKRFGWRILSLDMAVIAERPKIMARAGEIRACMGEALDIEPSRVSVKATTAEGLGAIGRGEGIAAHAVATIREA